MATLVGKLRGFPGSPYGRITTIPDAAVGRVLNAARARYGQVPVNPVVPDGPKRDMTDEETFARMWGGFIEGWLNNAFTNTRDAAAKTATQSIARDNATGEVTDNT
jgi:hypothetical protein